MQLAFNARILATEQLRGWSRYTANLIRELSYRDIKIHLLSDRRINRDHLKESNWNNLEIHNFTSPTYVSWEQWALPNKCKALKIDILHCPHHFGLPLAGNFKKVLTIHDTIEDSYYNRQKKWQQRLSPSDLQMDFLRFLTRQNADHILTVSETSRREIINYYGVAPEKISVTYNAADPVFSKQGTKETSLSTKPFSVQEPYFLYVGGFDKRKNIPFLIESFKEFLRKKSARLVIAGTNTKEVKTFARQTLDDAQFAHLHFFEAPSDTDLIGLYQQAHCFIYPSLYEGFGLQIAESMKMGTPVLASNVSCFPEIIGNQDCLFHPESKKQLVDLMIKSLEDENFYSRLREKAAVRGSQFSWQDTADKTMQVYRSLLK